MFLSESSRKQTVACVESWAVCSSVLNSLVINKKRQKKTIKDTKRQKMDTKMTKRNKIKYKMDTKRQKMDTKNDKKTQNKIQNRQ